MQLQSGLGISGMISKAFAWHIQPSGDQRGAQIDLLIDRNDNVIDLCEIKFTKDPYEMTKDDDIHIQARRSRFISATQTNKAVHLILISANGVKPNSYSDDYQAIITSDALFRE